MAGNGTAFNGSGPLAQQTYGDLSDCTDSAGAPLPCAVITRQSNLSIENKYFSAYLQDAVTFDRLTINLGVRWDRQYGDNRASTIQGNPTFPQVLPTVNYPVSTGPSPGPTGSRASASTMPSARTARRSSRRATPDNAEVLGTNTTGQINPTNTVSYGTTPGTTRTRTISSNPGRSISRAFRDRADTTRQSRRDRLTQRLRSRIPRAANVGGRRGRGPGGRPGPGGRRGVHASHFHRTALPLSDRRHLRGLRPRGTVSGTLPAAFGGGTYSRPGTSSPAASRIRSRPAAFLPATRGRAEAATTRLSTASI
jgi:hypothetical protein